MHTENANPVSYQSLFRFRPSSEMIHPVQYHTLLARHSTALPVVLYVVQVLVCVQLYLVCYE